MRIGTGPHLFLNLAGMATSYVLIALPRDKLRSEKHGIFRGMVGARFVLADQLHQAVQESSKVQEEEGIHPETTTRLIKARRISTGSE